METQVGGVGAGSLIKNNVIVDAVEPINAPGAGSTVENNYVVANGHQSGGHTEDICLDQTSGLTVTGNTLLNPFDQTAEIFGDTLTAACNTQLTIENNLLAGGGYVLYECAYGTSVGTASLTFTGNDVARCDGTPHSSGLGGEYCGSTDPSGGTYGSSIGYGQDMFGYWPSGGFFGFLPQASTYCSTISERTSGNGCTQSRRNSACVIPWVAAAISKTWPERSRNSMNARYSWKRSSNSSK